MPAYHINTQKCQNENAAKTVTKSKTKMILITRVSFGVGKKG